jgi:Ser/Thr protein kinase RdoA (MazF antagonist)
MLSKEVLGEHVRHHYGICGEIERIPKGRANNYTVSDQGTRWLLKVFQEEYSRARVEQAADFLRFVVNANYPARAFVRSGDGNGVVMLQGRATVLIPWIDGDTPEPNSLSSMDALRQVGRLCGYLHRLGGEYSGTARLQYAGSPLGVPEKLANLLRVAVEQCDEEISNQIGIRAGILAELGDELSRNYLQAPRGVIHGDFSASHVVFQETRATGVIDVTGEYYLPGWELMRAFFQSVPFAYQSPHALEMPWRAYVAGYLDECRIQPDRIAVAYDAYLLQLAASSYGLRQPLDDALRAFGQWRTRLARYLAEHRRELQELMVSLALEEV